MKNFSMYFFCFVIIASAIISIEYNGDFFLDTAGNILGVAALLFMGLVNGLNFND